MEERCGVSVYVSFSRADVSCKTECFGWVGQSATGGNYNFLFPLLFFLSVVLLLQRAQGRCLAVVVDALTGAARLRMMRWGEMYTETCSSNKPLLLFSVFFILISKPCTELFFSKLIFFNYYSYRRRILGTEVTRRKRKTSSGSSGRYLSYLCQLNYLFEIKHWLLKSGYHWYRLTLQLLF